MNCERRAFQIIHWKRRNVQYDTMSVVKKTRMTTQVMIKQTNASKLLFFFLYSSHLTLSIKQHEKIVTNLGLFGNNSSYVSKKPNRTSKFNIQVQTSWDSFCVERSKNLHIVLKVGRYIAASFSAYQLICFK